jgi:hydrogenase maturation factor
MSESCDVRERCITCGDVAVEMAVVTLDETLGLALCEDADGTHQSVEIALAAPVSVGDRLLVHAGTAIAHAAEAIR